MEVLFEGYTEHVARCRVISLFILLCILFNMALHGVLPKFEQNEDWELYSEQLQQYFVANDITEQKKKVAILLTVISPAVYKTLRDLCHPEAPQAKSFEDLNRLLKDHFKHHEAVFRERIKFYRATQASGEKIADWYARVKSLSVSCKFGNVLEAILRDKFVTGLSDARILKRVCEENETKSLKEMFDIAIKREAVLMCDTKEVNRLRQYPKRAEEASHASSTRNFPKTSRSTQEKAFKDDKNCFACGGTAHDFKTCKYKQFKCKICKRVGHIAKVCTKSQSQHFVQNVVSENQMYSQDNSHYNSKESSSSGDLDLFELKDNNSGPMTIKLMVEGNSVKWELDSGASRTVIPRWLYHKDFKHKELCDTEIVLRSYSGERMIPIGKFEVNVQFGNFQKTLEILVIDTNGPPLVGRDWIRSLKLIKIRHEPVFKVIEQLNGICEEFPELFSPGLGRYKYDKIKIELKQDAKPIFCKPRPLPLIFKEKVEKELLRLEKEGIITEIADSDWGTPLVPVLKKNGEIRICADYKTTVNRFLKDVKYPLPRIEELFTALRGGKEFTKLDLFQAYNQFVLDEQSKLLLSWSTHKGIFKINRMPFGIKPACSIFQQKIEKTLQGCKSVINFLDDIVITGCTRKEHVENLREVLSRLSKAGLKVNRDKCEFFSSEIRYLGHIISAEGLKKDGSKVQAILEAPVPINKKQVRAFAGLVNYYTRFAPNLSAILRPVYDLLKDGKEFRWTKFCDEAFAKAKHLLASDQVLTHFSPELPIKLSCDASEDGVGAVLSHIFPDGSERPIAFVSRVLADSEKNYSTVDREALAIFYGVKKFENYLMGLHFVLETDHKPLLAIFGENKGLPVFAASRLQRWAVYLSNFNYSIKYIKGEENGRPDCLSRLPTGKKPNTKESDNYLKFIYEQAALVVDAARIRIETRRDPIVSRVYDRVSRGWGSKISNEEEFLKPYFSRQDELTIEEGVVMWGYRVIIPTKLRLRVLEELHSTHLGVVKMKSLARSVCWWPGLDQDIEKFVKGCRASNLASPDPKKSSLSLWPKARESFERVHIDLFGPIGGHNFLILIDAFSKWIEVFVMSSTDSKTVLDKLREVFARFGIPKTIVSDNGRQFVSFEFENFCKRNGIVHKTSAPYHPATNGAAENAVGIIKKGLIKMLGDARNTIDVNTLLSRYLLGYRNAIHSSTGESPAILFLNRRVRIRLDMLKPNDRDACSKARDNLVKYHRGRRLQSFNVRKSG